MGDIISAIKTDIRRYIYLCSVYKETPKITHGNPDCYGDHTEKLLARAKQDKLFDMKRYFYQ